MPRTSASSLVRSQLDADDRRAQRFVDLQIDWVEFGTGRVVARFGGLWDRIAKDFAGDSPTSRVMEVHGAQVAAIERFDAWLAEHLSGMRRGRPVGDSMAQVRAAIAGDAERIDSELADAIGLAELFLSGGRRSGKTTIALGILASYAVSVPGGITWCVAPSEQFSSEPKEVLEAIMPTGWYKYRGDPKFEFTLVNGSQIVIRSGHRAGNLKKGKAALVAVNEAQQLPADSYRNARGAVIDAGGFVISALNPPTAGDIGVWTADAIGEIEKHERPGGEHIFIDPLENPHINHGQMLAMRSGMTEHDWQTQIRGRILAHPDTVLYTWSVARNEHAAPDFGKITQEFLTAHEGDRAAWSALVAVDVQCFPWIACGIFDVYRDPRDPKNPKAGLLWMRDEIALAQGDEIDVCAELVRRGVDPARSLVILDASCWWQQAVRDLMKQRPDFRGKGSADMFRQQGWKHCVKPDRNMKRNPDVVERVRATNATIRPADDISGLFIDPNRCPNAVESVRKWRMNRGKPSRNQKAAHFGDVIGYAVWRYFARRGSPAQMVSEAVPRERPGDYAEVERQLPSLRDDAAR